MIDNEGPLSVSELTGQVKELLEGTFPSVWVAGEISDFAQPRSGHCYFTLKDESAQIRGVIWRTTAAKLKFQPEDGMEVICRGALDLYPPRGSYQLVVRSMQPKGVGALELALRQLREKLAAEGLFDPARKRPLPKMVRKIAVVTSQTSAAIRDFLEILCRRWPAAQVLVVPVPVQGKGAADKIAEAIRAVNRFSDRPDCIVITRGGGSLEDLWAFNEEPLVRAVAESELITVSAIGHEIDVTLCDLAADIRAATPSEAAELVVPAVDQIQNRLDGFRRRIESIVQGKLYQASARLESIGSRPVFRRPWEPIFQRRRELDELGFRTDRAVRRLVEKDQGRLTAVAGRLESMSPLAVLSRGYSLTSRADDRRLIRSADEVATGEMIVTRLAKGEVRSEVV
jgi:exodeoxyribonuclease VII large subunit